jgi:hypothetical protein
MVDSLIRSNCGEYAGNELRRSTCAGTLIESPWFAECATNTAATPVPVSASTNASTNEPFEEPDAICGYRRRDCRTAFACQPSLVAVRRNRAPRLPIDPESTTVGVLCTDLTEDTVTDDQSAEASA